MRVADNILTKSPVDDLHLALVAYRDSPRQGEEYFPARGLMSKRLRNLNRMAKCQLQRKVGSPNLDMTSIEERRETSKPYFLKRVSKPLTKFAISDLIESICETKPKEQTRTVDLWESGVETQIKIMFSKHHIGYNLSQPQSGIRIKHMTALEKRQQSA